jgi:putative DNA primase/helicase
MTTRGNRADLRPIDEVLARLQSVKAHNGRWQACCPAHDDHNPSLSIAEADDGKVLLYCHAGCSFADIARALGLEEKDFFPRDGRPPNDRQIVATYDYHDESSELLYQTVKYIPKNFRQRRPDGNGGWIWNLEGTRRVLYRLPEVLAANGDEWVLVCEGEKSADAIRSLGLTATTAPLGAGKWRHCDQNPLKGRKVTVLPDADPQGQNHALEVVAALKDVSTARRIVKLPMVAPAQSDPADWVQAGGTKAELLRLVEEAADVADLEGPDGERLPDDAGGEIQARLYHLTDLGNARRLVERHGVNLRFCRAWGKWLVWDGRRWALDETGEVDRLAKDAALSIYDEIGRLPSAEQRKALASWAKSSEAGYRRREMINSAETEPEVAARALDFDRSPWLLTVLNGTLDLRTGELLPHRREDMITKLAPVGYDPDARCPLWRAFLDRVLAGSDDLARFLQCAVGYSLTADVSEQCLMILYGTGANGKTTFLQAISAMMGDYALQTPVETLLVKHGSAIPNDVARLRGARLVTAAEAEEGKRLAESLVKQVTGGDKVAARFLHGEFFEFTPSFKIWLGTNHKPIIKGTDHAIWRRIRLVPFTVTIPEEEQDRELGERLLAELPGILAWAVRGCLSWQKEGLGVPAEVGRATQAYRDELDALGGFLQDCCIVQENARARAGELYKAYRSWCEENGEKPLSQTRFGLRMVERGLDKVKDTYVYYLGIGLLDDEGSIPI